MTLHAVPISGCQRSASGLDARGFMLIGLLVLLALAGMSLSTYTQGAADARRRDNELELLWVGQQYRSAIASYYQATPGGVKQLPTSFDDLVLDTRFPQPVRHLRRLYPDPLAPHGEWGVERLNNQQIIGVYSQVSGEPFRKVDFDPGLESFKDAASYADWRFVWLPPRRSGRGAGARAQTPSASSPTSGVSLSP